MLKRMISQVPKLPRIPLKYSLSRKVIQRSQQRPPSPQRSASTTDVITFVLKTRHLMGQARIRLLSLFLILFPLSGSIFSRLATDLFDVSLWPFLLMLLLSSFKIISDATMDNFVPYFEMVLVGVSRFWHIDSSFVNVLGEEGRFKAEKLSIGIAILKRRNSATAIYQPSAQPAGWTLVPFSCF